ncbi:MAG: hypothetical protein ACXW0T_09255 [Methylobacter sp.]
MSISKKIAEKINFLFNDPVKKFVAGAVLVFAFLSLSDVSVILLETPSYGQLSISEGKIMIDRPRIRVGTPFYLIINKQKIRFSCAITDGMRDDCLFSETDFRKYQGKIGKVWWFETYQFGWFKGKRLYQLEVDGKLVISYQKQIEAYLRAKEGHFHSDIAALFLLIYGFFRLQLVNKSTISRCSTR